MGELAGEAYLRMVWAVVAGMVEKVATGIIMAVMLKVVLLMGMQSCHVSLEVVVGMIVLLV